MITDQSATFTFLILIGLIVCSVGKTSVPANQRFDWSHDRNSFTESPNYWTMEAPSLLLHMKKHQVLLLEFLFPDIPFSTYKLHVTCDKEQKTVEISRTKLVHEKYEVCTATKNPMQLTREIKFTKDVVKTREYQVIDSLVLENEPSVPLHDVFTHYTSLKFGIELPHSKFNRHGNTMYIRNWDSAFKSQNKETILGVPVTKWFLTSEPFKYLPSSIWGSGPRFNRMRYVNTEISAAIKKASEFVKSSVSIGFIMVFNADSCSNADETNSIPFMPDSYAMLPKFPEAVKVVRLSQETGWLTFFQRGLNELTKKVIGNTASKIKSSSCKPSKKCTKILFCAKLEYSSIGGTFPYSRTELAVANEKPIKFFYPGFINFCYPLRTRKIKVFARAALTYITCPIICDIITVQYNFYKEKVHLKPMSGQEFTAYGGMEVHESGTMLRVSQSATHLDNGRYSCRAGRINEYIDVEVIALPVFHIPGTKFINYLPKKVYKVEGETMIIDAKVFHSGMSSVERQVKFHLQIKHNGKHFKWASFTQDEFQTNEFRHLGTCSSKVSRDPTFTTNDLRIEIFRGKSHAVSESYLIVFSAIVKGKDAETFGIPEYEATTQTELVVMKRPVESDFKAQMSSCCSTECYGKDCVTEFQINKHLMAIWAEDGITVDATFRMGSSLLPDYMKKMVRFNADSGTLKFVTNRGIKQMSKDEKLQFGNLIPVFWFFFPKGSSVKNVVIFKKKPIPKTTGSLDCKYDKLCLYTTLQDSALCDKFKFSNYFNLLQTTTTAETLTPTSTPFTPTSTPFTPTSTPLSVTESSTFCESIEQYMKRLKRRLLKAAGIVRPPTIFLSVTIAIILALLLWVNFFVDG